MLPSWAGEKMPECLSLICHRLVGLTWYEGETHPDGKYCSKPEWRCASAFVADIADKAWLVTAGHVFNITEKLKRSNPNFKTSEHMVWDVWSPKATVAKPIPFDFFDQDVARFSIDEAEEGIDLALIPLSAHPGRLLAQTIAIFPRNDWLDSDEHDYDAYFIVGTPSCVAEEEVTRHESGGSITNYHRPSLVALERIDQSEVQKRRHPQFVARIHDEYFIGSIEGMSGGPILGFRQNEHGVLRYWPVAIQSRWIERKRIVIGTLLAPCLRAFESLLIERLAAASPDR